MKFFLAATLFTAVLGAPLVDSLVERDGNGTESNLDIGPAFPPAPKAHILTIFTSDTPEPVEAVKRSAEVLDARSELTKRAIVIDVWQDTNRSGRHEGLITDINRCYSLGNGWNDAISSLQTPPNYGCYFYVDGDCKGGWLSVAKTSNYVFVNTPDFGYNDKISSYLCYT